MDRGEEEEEEPIVPNEVLTDLRQRTSLLSLIGLWK